MHRLVYWSHKLKDRQVVFRLQVSFQLVYTHRSTPLYFARASNGMEFKYFLACDDFQLDKNWLGKSELHEETLQKCNTALWRSTRIN